MDQVWLKIFHATKKMLLLCLSLSLCSIVNKITWQIVSSKFNFEPFCPSEYIFWFIYKLNDLKALKSWFSFFFSISSKCILVFPRRWWRKTIHVQWNPFNIYRQNREVKSYKRKIFLQLNLFVFCCFLTFPFPPFHIYSYQITLVLALP